MCSHDTLANEFVPGKEEEGQRKMLEKNEKKLIHNAIKFQF